MVGLEPYISQREARRIPQTPVQRCPVLSRLTQLALVGGNVLSPCCSLLSTDVAPRTPAYQSLTLAVHDSSFDLHALLHDVRFPHLQALGLDILAPEAPSNARTLAILLERTPTLQHVTWRHLDPDALSTSALPALRTLRVEEVPGSPGAAGRALLQSGADLEALGNICVDAAALGALAHMGGDALRCLEIVSFESIAVLVRAVQLFPRLRWLRLPAVDYWHEHSSVTPAPVHLVRPFRAKYMHISV